MQRTAFTLLMLFIALPAVGQDQEEQDDHVTVIDEERGLVAISGYISGVNEDGTLSFTYGKPPRSKKKDDRWKVSLGVSVSPVTGEPVISREGWRDFNFRADEGLQQWVLNFRHEYLVPHGATSFSFNPPVLARCCRNDSESFRVGPDGFSGKIGDEYETWEREQLHGIHERGIALDGSLEYRVTGPLWAAFSVQRSRETAVEYSKTSEYFRVEDIGFVPCGNCPPSYQRSHLVEFSRNRVRRDFRKSYRSASFAALAKVDVTRGNSHWSVLPQAGVDLLVSSEQFIRTTENSQWKIFDGEGHGSDWARRPERIGEVSEREILAKRYVVRPVVGLVLEVYPAKKKHHFAIKVDGRYHFGGRTTYEHNGPREAIHWGDSPVRPFTLSIGALVRF